MSSTQNSEPVSSSADLLTHELPPVAAATPDRGSDSDLAERIQPSAEVQPEVGSHEQTTDLPAANFEDNQIQQDPLGSSSEADIDDVHGMLVEGPPSVSFPKTSRRLVQLARTQHSVHEIEPTTATRRVLPVVRPADNDLEEEQQTAKRTKPNPDPSETDFEL
ncbi:hypothetical protein R1sor_023811 [Riccia sorocarpa]|uniref:Uncharacterized protein n=1 Tax=Riccia sorocarpa TaxID=122646 RepID=A0ABD3GRX9_9MARC